MPVPDQTTPQPGAVTPFVPEGRTASFDGEAVTGRQRLSAEPSDPFFLAHATGRGNWSVESEGLDEPTWLPTLQEIPVDPGASGMVARSDSTRPASDMYDRALLQLARRGFIVIPRRTSVGGVSDYLVEVDCRHPRTGAPGVRHMDVFSTPIPPRPGKRMKHRRDRTRYNRWRLALVEGGIIAPPSPEELMPQFDSAAKHINETGANTQIPEDRRREVLATARSYEAFLKSARVPERRLTPVVVDTPPPTSADALIEAIEAGEHDARLTDLLLIEDRTEVLTAIRARAKARKARKEAAS